MNMKKQILEMFFQKEMKCKDIAQDLNISTAYITKVIKQDSRYEKEKYKRKELNKEKHNEKTKELIKKQRDKIQFCHKVDDLILRKMHEQATMELSKNSKLSDMAYRNWNTSAYKYNQAKKRFEFREELGKSYDVKKYLKG